jgi:cytochrome c oxidase subunit IV
MSESAHHETNYMAVFWWLLALTVIEVAVIYLPIAKMAIAVMLVTMAVTKAALVAMYFMHLKFEKRTLALVALSPFVMCVFLILMLTPDIFPR